MCVCVWQRRTDVSHQLTSVCLQDVHQRMSPPSFVPLSHPIQQHTNRRPWKQNSQNPRTFWEHINQKPRDHLFSTLLFITYWQLLNNSSRHSYREEEDCTVSVSQYFLQYLQASPLAVDEHIYKVTSGSGVLRPFRRRYKKSISAYKGRSGFLYSDF